MKYFPILVLVSLFCLCCSERKSIASENWMRLNDSAVVLIFEWEQHHDSSAIKLALALLDSALNEDTVTEHRFKYYGNRAAVYNLLGDSIRSFQDRKHQIELLPPTHLDRLIFYGEEYKMEGKKDASNYYLSKAIEQCEKELSTGYKEDIVIKKVQILVLMDKKQEAIHYIKEELKNHPSDELLLSVEESIDSRKIGDSSDHFLK